MLLPQFDVVIQEKSSLPKYPQKYVIRFKNPEHMMWFTTFNMKLKYFCGEQKWHWKYKW